MLSTIANMLVSGAQTLFSLSDLQQCCFMFFVDEPECPQSLIER